MTLKEAQQRIEDLERKVKELEARPQEVHHHYHPPTVQPQYPFPGTLPVWTSTTIGKQ